ncbi:MULTISPECIES: gluconokinase [unclassified Streptomyces]|uniref:gluconokinase n=1 Tax=unclassified Streptomyces TaxID=2593676 RepID=UPI0022587F03|nr:MULTISPECIES: gluconokinase [unclassified Streptomyces]MCX4524130.1 gluconokinase [Streptomyces sp. NBC_01551]MCX4545352.1 gluconokinase [Streptomyces sp. NBC_01565]
MGVSGSGKSTVGRLLAARREVPFVEGDDFHPAANIAKMRAGHPLDDADREPWLTGLADGIRDALRAGAGAVVSCSALKRKYRDRLRAVAPGVWFLHLTLDRAVARARVTGRAGHFMPVRLLESQYDVLEPLGADEPGLTVDAGAGADSVLGRAGDALAEFEARRGAGGG